MHNQLESEAYLEFNGYVHTASVLSVEAGLCSTEGTGKLCREVIKCELGLNESKQGGSTKNRDNKRFPLIYGIVTFLKEQKGNYRTARKPTTEQMTKASY